MYLKSFLQPTRMTGVSGQNRRISGYHIALQFRKDTGLAIEKHRSTTSDRPYAKRRSLSWSPNVSHSLRDTFTPSTTSHERSNTYGGGRKGNTKIFASIILALVFYLSFEFQFEFQIEVRRILVLFTSLYILY